MHILFYLAIAFLLSVIIIRLLFLFLLINAIIHKLSIEQSRIYAITKIIWIKSSIKSRRYILLLICLINFTKCPILLLILSIIFTLLFLLIKRRSFQIVWVLSKCFIAYFLDSKYWAIQTTRFSSVSILNFLKINHFL